VTLSGQLNGGYGKDVTTSATKAALINNTANGTNITLAAAEDLGGGLKATADINVRFSPASGVNVSNTTDTATGKDPFAQNVAMGLSGGFGTIKAGRFTSGIAAPIGGYDPFGTDMHGVAVGSAATGLPARSNGTIQYATPAFNGFKLTVETALKGNTAAAAKDSNQYVVSYAAGPLSAMVGGGTLADDSAVKAFAASYDLGMAKPSVAWVKVGSGATAKTEKSIAAGVPMGAMTLKAGYRVTTVGSAEDVKRTAVGVTYALSKRTSLIADYATESQTGAAGKNGYVVGMRHAF